MSQTNNRTLKIRFPLRGLAYTLTLAFTCIPLPSLGLDGDNYQMVTHNGWEGFEIISYNDNPADDGYDYSMPGTFDGIGAQLVDDVLRIQVNHELSRGEASISEVRVNVDSFKTAINNVAANGDGDTGVIPFVLSARQAYTEWSADGGATWKPTTNAQSTTFQRFCSGQSYVPNTFGPGRGIIDPLYITGEESSRGRLFVLDLENDQLYLLSGVTGNASTLNGGMPLDAWENAALVDTGETDHIALLLSPDGGTRRMQIYIGEKGKGLDGLPSESFLARNGLAYGSYYYLIDSLPAINGTVSTNGAFSRLPASALASSKLEDVDTSPVDGTKVVLADQNSGIFTFVFDLDFSSGTFDAESSGFTLTKIADHFPGVYRLDSADNIDWCGATTLNGTTYPDGLIFVNEDNSSGEVWMMEPDGSGKILLAGTIPSTESSGVLDISTLLGYSPGSILLTDNQTTTLSSLSALISPYAALPFAYFTPGTMHVHFGETDKSDHLLFTAYFQPGEASDGIDLNEDDLMLTAGPFEIHLPAGSFKKTGAFYRWSSRNSDMAIKAALGHHQDGSYSFSIRAHGIDLTGWSNPENWTLTIGDDSGTATTWLKGHLQSENDPFAGSAKPMQPGTSSIK